MDQPWDCIVVGAGAAGLSAALVLGRARRRTLVIDAGRQSNLAAEGIGGLLGADARPPGEFYAAGRAELTRYPTVELRDGEVVGGEPGFVLELAGGGVEHARTVLLATGMEYRPPDLPGIPERWGRSVFHCPFCHGWEARERPLGVLEAGSEGARRALLRSWSDDVTLLTSGPSERGGDRGRRAPRDRTARRRRRARRGGPRRRRGAGLPRAALPVTLHQRSALAERLGAATAERAPLAPSAVEVDAMFATSVPGLYAAGDVVGRMPSVANSIANGSNAAAMIVMALAERVGRADADGAMAERVARADAVTAGSA